MNGLSAAALVMARAPRPGACKTRLQPVLGPDGCARVQAALIVHSTAWATEAAPGAVFVAYTPDDPQALEEVGDLLPVGTDLFSQEGDDLGARLAHATARVLAHHGGPLLVVGTDLPSLAPRHAATALEDLQAGCDVVFGPAFDGGYYLVAMTEPRPELFALPPQAWGGDEVFALSIAAAAHAGLEIGLLDAERDLDTLADARAAIADPATPPRLAALLRPALAS